MTSSWRRQVERLEKRLPAPKKSKPGADERALAQMSDELLGQVCANLRTILVHSMQQGGLVQPDEIARLDGMPDADFLAWTDRRYAEVERGDYVPAPVAVTFQELDAIPDTAAAVPVDRPLFCGQCAGPISAGDGVCRQCGAELCPCCAALLSAEDLECPACGTGFVFTCPGCGAELDDEADECPQCGTRLGE